jgi:hypothetical protein
VVIEVVAEAAVGVRCFGVYGTYRGGEVLVVELAALSPDVRLGTSAALAGGGDGESKGWVESDSDDAFGRRRAP